jgi:hypothetical protein
MTSPRATVEQFVTALAARDLAAAMRLYAPAATWEVHVPDMDDLLDDPSAIAARMDPWFTGRDGFLVARHRVIGDGPELALQWELHWRDAHDGAPCVSHQTHVFEVADGLIERHWLYCAGVRVYDLPAEPEDADVIGATLA